MEKVGIEIELMGGEEAFALLQRIDSKIDTLNRKKKFNSLSGLKSAKGELEAYIAELQRLQKEQEKWESLAKRVGKENMSAFGVRAWEKNSEAIAKTTAQVEKMSREMDEATTKTRTLKQVFNSWSSQIAHVGGAMQSFGNALTRIGSFMRPITSGLLLGAGYKVLNLFTEGFSNAFERADTMKNYDRTLKALGLDVTKTFSIAGKEAKTAKENLDDAVQGLPTSLDEIMAAQKVYAGATGEMVESTKTAIAANNTFLASGMGSREQRFMQKYLVALASGANLTTTQWQSMARIAPLAMRAVSKELGYAGDEYAQFTKDVQKGTISGKEFLKAFQKVGVSGAIADAARAQTESWNGLFSNIRIAVTRMGANVLDTLNQTFKDATGRTLLQRLLGWDAEGKDLQDGVKSWINGISDSVQNWIKANPDRIIEFFENLKAIDVKGFLKGLAQGMGDLLGIIERFAKIASNKDMSKLGRFLAKAGFYGRAFTIIGGVIKGMRHPLAAIGTAGSWLFKGRKAGGFFGKIAELFGKKQDIETAGEVGEAIGKATPNLISAFKNMALISGIIAMPAFTAWGVTAAVKNSIKNFKETITLLKDMDWSSAAKLASGIAVFLGASAGLGALVGKFGVGAGVDIAIGETIVGIIMTIATGFADLNMALIKGSIKKFVESVKLLGEIPDVSSFGDVKAKISNAITMLNEISILFQGRYVDKGVKEGGIQGAGLFTSFSINSITKSLAGLKKAVKAVQDLANVSIPEGAADNIKRAVDAVSEASSNMWKLWGLGYGSVKNNTENIIESLTNLKKIIKQINGLKGVKVKKGGITAVKDAITNIGNAFDAAAIGDIRVKITAFVASIQDAFTMFDKLNKTITIKTKVKLSKDFESSVDEVVRQINSARGRIRRAWNAIPDSLSKTITLTVNGKVNASGALNGISKGVGSNVNKLVEKGNSILDRYQANGGMIYRAKGGSVGFPGRPIGTDRVPVWATAGEFVQNKRAVSMFGIDFMRKVNNLDMKGAMNELMHRAGHMANINRGTTITNNNYNNQKVVINNSNAGAGYTFRTASRFVGAF